MARLCDFSVDGKIREAQILLSLESFEEIGGTFLQIKLVCIDMTCQRTLKVFILIFS